MSKSARNPRVFLDVVPWDCRSHNTDWKYVRYMLPRLVEWEPSLELVVQESRWVTLQANLKAIRMAVGKRLGFPVPVRTWETDPLDAAELKASRCDIIFNHRGYPTNASDTPVIWQSSILDPEMAASFGHMDVGAVLLENEIRHELFGKAALVQVSTEAEAIRLSASYPELAGRFVPVPFFLPHLEAAPAHVLERHRSPERIEVLFVGNDAWRKGLDLLVAAFERFSDEVRQRVHLTVVSSFRGPEVRLPDGATILRKVDQTTVLRLMRKSHILVNVARFESYGLVFLEAMSQGMACIGPNWEVQRELLDCGRAGINVACESEHLAETLLSLIHDEVYRLQIATAAHRRFIDYYAPAVVAKQYAAMFRRAAKLRSDL